MDFIIVSTEDMPELTHPDQPYTQLVPVDQAVRGSSPTPESVLQFMTAGRRSAATQRAYKGDLRHFFAWRGQELTPEALGELCALDTGSLALVMNDYAAHMRTGELSEATSNRRLSALRSLLKLARKFGLSTVDPAGLVEGEKVKRYRDTRGPKVAEVKQLLITPDRETPIGKRDFAILTLLWENALRRSELCGCSIGDFDADGRRLTIRGKGRGTQTEPVTLSVHCVAAINAYLETRAGQLADAPLFANAARFNPSGSRLTADGLYYLLQKYGAAALGRPVNPHAMRHAAITAVLDATNGDVRTTQKLSRHADVRTLMIYDDNRSDLQGKATELLSGLV